MGKDGPRRGAQAGDLTPSTSSLFGRRVGRPLKKGRREALEELRPVFEIPVPETETDPKTWFGATCRECWLEIGSGNGEHAVWQAERNPHAGVIAVEPFVNGASNTLALVRESGVRNLRVHMDDARPLMAMLQAQSLSKVFILFPDPWPKRRHWRRRIVNGVLLRELARLMPAGAELRIATDHPGYLVWILRQMQNSEEFRWTAASSADWTKPPPDWRETRFEEKGQQAGRPATYLRYERV